MHIALCSHADQADPRSRTENIGRKQLFKPLTHMQRCSGTCPSIEQIKSFDMKIALVCGTKLWL